MNNEVASYNMVEHLLLNNSIELPEEVERKVKRLRRETVDRPVIYVGSGTCGQVAGAKETSAQIQKYLEENNQDAEVVEVGCIGMCWAEPLVDIQLPGRPRISYQKVTPQKVTEILDATFNTTYEPKYILGQFKNPNIEPWEKIPYIEDLPFYKNQKRIVLEDCGILNPVSIDEYVAHGGYKAMANKILYTTPAGLREEIIKSGLRGRGGGGFLTGEKWHVAADAEGEQKYLVCNADESDPGAFMDRALIEGNPHLLIEGIIIAAYAIGTSKCYVYIRSSYELAIKRLREAINESKEAGLIGHNILDSGFNIQIKLKNGAGAFVCGEETALINSLEGKRGIPRPKPPYPAQQGLFNKPTVVNNAETLANVPKILKKGVDWYTQIGTEKSPGTKVFALAGKINQPGLIEVPMGTSFRRIIDNIAGGMTNGGSFKAAQIGGPSGSCIAEENLDAKVDYESLAEIDAIMGSGGLVVADDNTCMVDLARFFMDFLQKSSCGKCIPCREGTRRMLEILESITRRPQDNNHSSLDRFKGIMQLEELGKVIEDTSLCGLGQTAPKPVLSALHHFREEFEEHIFDRKCRANVCRDLRSYYIDVEACTGCTICMEKCPEGAIIGTAHHPHFIVEDKCTGCGICYDVCKFDAVFLK